MPSRQPKVMSTGTDPWLRLAAHLTTAATPGSRRGWSGSFLPGRLSSRIESSGQLLYSVAASA